MWWDRQWWGQVLREPLMVTRGAPTLPREDQVEREKKFILNCAWAVNQVEPLDGWDLTVGGHGPNCT